MTTLPLLAYRAATWVARPLLPGLLARRAQRGKEVPDRRHERLGRPTQHRPDGPLVWMHGASVGESHVVSLLADALIEADPAVTVLATTQTVTAANRFAAQPTNNRLIHQFVPVDTGAAVAGFLNHWHPDVAVWVESELWPNLIGGVGRRGTPALLVNARMSAKSHRRWQRFGRTARSLLTTFDAIFPADALAASRLQALGLGDRLRGPGNLKLSAETLPVDPTSVADLQGAIGDRPVWLAASTHPEDERVVLDAHRQVLSARPDALLIVAPRHPDRGQALAADFSAASRSSGALPDASHAVYVADTLGELGSLFQVAPVVFVAGSFGGHGGHNPIEPARFGAAILHGPDMANFSDTATRLREAGGSQIVSNAGGLATAVLALMDDDKARRRQGDAAATALARNEAVRDAVVDQIRQSLGITRCR